MMMNLFSVFDPGSSIMSIQLNWLSTVLELLMIPFLYRMMYSWYSILFNKLTNTLHYEFKLLSNTKGLTALMLLFLVLIMFNNTMGLIPYVFTSMTHMVMTLSLALPLWLSFMLYGWINNTNHMFIHLVPQGTPGLFMMFMVLIETVSNMIRPGTLAIRLAANMIAGHLLLTLLGNQVPYMGTYMITGTNHNTNYTTNTSISSSLNSIMRTGICCISSLMFISNMLMSKTSHPYHMVNPSPWPVLAAISVFATMSSLTVGFHSSSYYLLVVGNSSIIFVSLQWWRGIMWESTLQGLHI